MPRRPSAAQFLLARRARHKRDSRQHHTAGISRYAPRSGGGSSRAPWTIGQMEKTLAGRQLADVESGYTNVNSFENTAG